MKKSYRLQQDDRGGRRRVKDRRYQVSVATGEDRRTHWRRRSGLDQRTQDPENT